MQPFSRQTEALPEQMFVRSPVFRRLRNFAHVRDNRPQELDVWVYEAFLTLPRMDMMRTCLEGHPPQKVAMALLDMIRLAAAGDPPGQFTEFILGLRGRLVDDWGIPSEAMLAALLSCGMVEHIGNSICAFSAPEMVTFPKVRSCRPIDISSIAKKVSSGPYMVPHAVACQAQGPTQLRLHVSP